MDGQNSASAVQLSTFTKVQSFPRKDGYGDFPVTVRVTAPTMMPVHVQTPVDIVVVVDTSSDMGYPATATGSKTKITVLREAMARVIQKLGGAGNGNRLAILPFGDAVYPEATPLVAMDEQGIEIAATAVRSFTPYGHTNIAPALNKAVQILDERQAEDEGRSAFIVFISDGDDENFKKESIQTKYQIHAFAIGDRDPEVMKAMAEMTGGSYTSITEDITMITEKLAQLTEKLTSVVAVDTRIRLLTGVSLSRVESKDHGGSKYNCSITGEEKSGEICISSLSSGEEREFMVYLDVPQGDSDAVQVLAVDGVYTQSWDKKKVQLGRRAVNLVLSYLVTVASQ